MTNVIDIGTLTGIKDVDGKDIRNGDRIRVQHLAYSGTHREFIEEKFTARVFYDEDKSSFLYIKEGVEREEEDENDNVYRFDQRNSRFEIVRDENA